jgi:predicted nucleic acid-binding protein
VIVIDASCALKLLLRQGNAETLAKRLLSEEIHAPHLIDVEVLSGVRRLLRLKQVSHERAKAGLEWFLELAIERHGHAELAWRIFDLRDNVSAYDAAYVAVAELAQAPLLTADGRLARSHGHRARIEAV